MKKVMLIGLLLFSGFSITVNKVETKSINDNLKIAEYYDDDGEHGSCDGLKDANTVEVEEYNLYHDTNCDNPNEKKAKKITLGLLIWLLICVITWLYGFIKNKQLGTSSKMDLIKNYNPLELSYYVHKGNFDNRSFAAMILYFGEKGYLKIDTDESQSLVLIKLKDIDDHEPAYIQRLFNIIFSDEKIVFDPQKLSCQFTKNYEGLKMSTNKFLKHHQLLSIGTKIAKRICLIGTIIACALIFLSIYPYQANLLLGVLLIGFMSIFYFINRFISDIRLNYKDELVSDIIIIIVFSGLISIIIGLTLLNLYIDLMIGFSMGIILSLSILFTLAIFNYNKAHKDMLSQALTLKAILKNDNPEQVNQLIADDQALMAYIYALGDSKKIIAQLNNKSLAPNWADYFNQRQQGNKSLLAFINVIEQNINTSLKRYGLKKTS